MSGTTYAAIGSSTFLDFAAYELTSSANFDSIKAISGTSLSADQLAVVGAVIQSAFYGSIAAEVAVSAAQSSESITIALVLDRANDPSTLLSGNWAERQAALADQPGVAASYGADPAAYQGVLDAVTGTGALNGLTGTTYLTDGYYVSTAESRTIWLSLTAEEFAALFNTELLAVEASTENGTSKFYAWAGELSLPTEIAGSVAGLWVDQSKAPAYPEVANNDAVDPSTLGNGALGIGNGTTTVALDTPDAIARLYDFPLSEAYYHVANGTATEQELLIASLAAPTVAMLEASTLGTLESYLNDYRALLNLPGYSSAATGDFAAVDFTNLAGIGDSTSGETALDVSIIATASPNSSQVLYGYSGETTYTGYQWAIFDEENAASILSSSYSDHVRPTPDSPFAWAYQQLFVDAQLRNITVLMSSDDGGSSGQYGTGGRLVHSSHAVSSAIIVGGTSLSTYDVARSDTTLATIVAAANSNDVATLLQLVAGGLSIAPGHLSGDDVHLFVETVWNQYHLTLHEDGHYAMEPSYLTNDAGGGGVDKTQSMPSYQAAYGQALEGRGIPDVAALAGGNTYYDILNHNYDGTDANSLTEGDGGTSASAPLWAALTAQLDVIFADQGLPELGYYNDLLYIASAIAPGAFNDITQGDNTSSFFHYYNANGDVDYLIAARSQGGGHERILATDEGYSASSGYDLTTGLGTPNGLLLARALSAIAHTQVGGSAQPDVVSGLDDTTAASGANQTLLVQVTGALDTYQVTLGDHVVTGATDGEGLISSDAVVQKMLQSDFDPELVKLLDGGSHVSATTVDVDAGDAITATAGGVSLGLYQAGLTAGYGFAAFGGDELGVTVARPVTIAETPGGAGNQDVVVRLRQSGVAESTLMIYQVEDLLGTIEGLRPGDATYGAAAEAMAYSLQGGGTVIEGPGFGNYAEVVLTGVNDGDILAMRFATTTDTYWAFAQANEARIDGEHATHVWSYGLNTWGWEDRTEAEGADQDFNDLIVQFDFTSLTGHDLLV